MAKFTLREPKVCPACESIAFRRISFIESFWRSGIAYQCCGCGFEVSETIDDIDGKRRRESRWPKCSCCHRPLSGESAIDGIGYVCAHGHCQCRTRRANKSSRP